jgi:DNA-binding helix-turn-helix protein
MLRKEYAENPFQKEEYGRLLKLAQGRRNQKQFCEDAGLSRSYINKYINAMMDKPPTIGTIEKIADATEDVSFEELLAAAGYDPEKHERKELLEGKESNVLQSLIMSVLLNIMNSDYEWSISSKGYREGEPVQVVIENEPVRDWYFIPVTKKDVAREDILAALMSDQQFTNTSKVSFVTQNEIIYDRIRTMQFPLLSLYVSAIRINGKNIEESELKTNQMMNKTQAVNQSKQVFSIH